MTVEIRGVDVFDPTTGEVRSRRHGRHRLLVHRHRLRRRELLRPPRLLHRRRRALREAQDGPAAEIDEGRGRRSTARRAAVRPRRQSGKIAVKVINHYRDEVLKVYPVR